MQAVITIGISASGKTFWANGQKNYTIISRDDIRREILCDRLDRELKHGELWSMWKWKDESLVTELVQDRIASCAANKHNIIIADTNLVEKYRTMMVTKLESLGYEVLLKTFPISYEDAVKRDNGRPDGVGAAVIWKQYLQFNETMGRRVATPNSHRSAVIVDVDGTLAHMQNRGPFEWDKVETDSLDEEVACMVRGLSIMYTIIVVSGRDGCCREATERWLKNNNVPYDQLFMRPAGDSRDDRIIKEEIFWRDIEPFFDVKLVIDDRPKVCRTWTELGLKVARMADPLKEF